MSHNTSFTILKGNASIYANGESSKTYIQDFTKANCQSLASSANYTVYDSRDERSYTVRYINDACWMTQNLAIGCTTSGSISSKSLTTSDSNVSSTWSTPARNLSTNTNNAFSPAMMACSSDASYGAWYNFCAAAVGNSAACSDSSYSGSNDICPLNWHLPSYNAAPGAISGITDSVTAFSPVYSGRYDRGKLGLTGPGGTGRWWSATANSSGQYVLYYNGSLYIDYHNKILGLSVRCVRTS